MSKRYRVQTIRFGRNGSTMPKGVIYQIRDLSHTLGPPVYVEDPIDPSKLLTFETLEQAQAKVYELNARLHTLPSHL